MLPASRLDRACDPIGTPRSAGESIRLFVYRSSNMTHIPSRIPVAVLGATGMVGQRFIELLQEHPWFELVALAASDHHGGRPYAEATRWRLPNSEMPAAVASLPVLPCRPEAMPDVKIAFSALPGEIAGDIELAFAQAGV